MQEANYDESKAELGPLPEVLICDDGTKITSAAEFTTRRRPEILHHFESIMYGKVPPTPENMCFELLSERDDALGGKAIRREVALIMEHRGRRHEADLLVYLPKNHSGAVPAIVNLNFNGNRCCVSEPDIRATRPASITEKMGPPDDPSRHGVEYRIDRGYAVLTAARGDFFPDCDTGRPDSIYSLFTPEEVSEDSGAISAWAFGVMRMVDYLYTLPEIDRTRIYVHGHSRLGKTALWAAANDPRLAGAVSNNSGCCGAALDRRNYGETIPVSLEIFPWWFSRKLAEYAGRLTDLPFDQHMLLSLIAPRPLLVASATEDKWADPKGEFLSVTAAEEVYRLFGGGLGTAKMPEPDAPVFGVNMGYYLRTGPHGVRQSDWRNTMDFFGKCRGE